MLSPDPHWHPGNMIYGDDPLSLNGYTLVPNIRAIRQSGNLYAYCMNNPIMFIDPSGRTIVLSPNATDEQKYEYWRSIEYLMQSATFKTLYSILEASSMIITMSFHTSLTSAYYNPAKQTISWNPFVALVLGDGVSVMSAAMALAHEMGHAAQHITGYLDGYYDGKLTRAQVEANNLSTYETPIAKELGEFWRKNYGDYSKQIRTNHSTDWGVYHSMSWWSYFWSGDWNKPRQSFENLNPWRPKLTIGAAPPR